VTFVHRLDLSGDAIALLAVFALEGGVTGTGEQDFGLGDELVALCGHSFELIHGSELVKEAQAAAAQAQKTSTGIAGKRGGGPLVRRERDDRDLAQAGLDPFDRIAAASPAVTRPGRVLSELRRSADRERAVIVLYSNFTLPPRSAMERANAP